ncbi:MAG: hypothetical protein IPK03_05420 [Bacteroidetes bacterium]|nr:hypothetical protein [Bacteroidota bacterium]
MIRYICLFILIAMQKVNYGQLENSHYCHYADSKVHIDLCDEVKASSMSHNLQAQRLIDMICTPISSGLSFNFTLIPCDNIPDAMAKTTRDGTRFIIYNPSFIKTIKFENGDTNYIGPGIIAHEIRPSFSRTYIDLYRFR